MKRKYRCDQALYEFTKCKKATKGKIISKIWKYVKKKKLQDPKEKKMIVVDSKLQTLTGPGVKVGSRINGRKLGKYVKKHAT